MRLIDLKRDTNFTLQNQSAVKGQKLGLCQQSLIFLSHRRVSPFSRGVIFTRARVLLALPSLRKTGDDSQSNRITPYHGSPWFFPCFRGWFWQNNPLVSMRDINLTFGLLPPPEDTWYGVILWVLRVLGQGLNQSARIFFIRAFSGCYAILTSPKKGETAVYGYNPALC